jgi:hypothetical protein
MKDFEKTLFDAFRMGKAHFITVMTAKFIENYNLEDKYFILDLEKQTINLNFDAITSEAPQCQTLAGEIYDVLKGGTFRNVNKFSLLHITQTLIDTRYKYEYRSLFPV